MPPLHERCQCDVVRNGADHADHTALCIKRENLVSICMPASHGVSGASCPSDMLACRASDLPHYAEDLTSCMNELSNRKCTRKAIRGKCHKRRMKRKCKHACGLCIG